jgi:Ca2+-binding EF-hand superfamily protein
MNDNEILVQLRTQLTKRGTRGITGIGRAFRIADIDRSGHLSNAEAMKAFRNFRINLTDDQNQILFNMLDQDNNG